MQKKYHIEHSGKRTTVSVDTILSDIWALKRGLEPNSRETRRELRKWIEKTLGERFGLFEWHFTSQAVRDHLIREIIDQRLLAQYDEWVIKNG